MKAIRVKQIRGKSQCSTVQKATLKALGVHGIGTTVDRTDTRALRGMLNKVQHLISAEQVDVTKKTPQKKSNLKGYTIG